MTYFGFLARYVVAPALALRLYEGIADSRGKTLPESLRAYPFWGIVAAHAAIAVLYTTPWDNYLVATRVWWYDPARVTGHRIGWVPIEEYAFFVLQPLLTGGWLGLLARFLRSAPPVEMNDQPEARIRKRFVGIGMLVWLIAVMLLARGPRRTIYLSLLLGWGLPPLIFQWLFGADILWRRRKLVIGGFAVPTLYLALADRLAITNGNWTINPGKTTGLKLFRGLPVEEFLFFLLTNVLIASGVTLMIDQDSKRRALALIRQFRSKG